MEATQIKD